MPDKTFRLVVIVAFVLVLTAIAVFLLPRAPISAELEYWEQKALENENKLVFGFTHVGGQAVPIEEIGVAAGELDSLDRERMEKMGVKVSLLIEDDPEDRVWEKGERLEVVFSGNFYLISPGTQVRVSIKGVELPVAEGFLVPPQELMAEVSLHMKVRKDGSALLETATLNIPDSPLASLYRTTLLGPAVTPAPEEERVLASSLDFGHGQTTQELLSEFLEAVLRDEYGLYGVEAEPFLDVQTRGVYAGDLVLSGVEASTTKVAHLASPSMVMKIAPDYLAMASHTVTQIIFAQWWLENQRGNQYLSYELELVIEFPENSTILNADQIHGLRWEADFNPSRPVPMPPERRPLVAASILPSLEQETKLEPVAYEGYRTHREASVRIEGNRVIISDNIRISEMSIDPCLELVENLLAGYKQFEIEYVYPGMPGIPEEGPPLKLSPPPGQGSSNWSWGWSLPVKRISAPLEYQVGGVKVLEGDFGVGLNFSGEVAIEVGFKWEWPFIELKKIEAVLGLDVDPQATIEVEAAHGVSWDLYDWRKRLGQVTFWAGPVPVWVAFWFEGEVNLELQGKIEGIEASAWASAGLRLGVRWTSERGWEPIYEKSLSSKFELEEIKAQATINLKIPSVKLMLAAYFYDLAGPFVGVEPYNLAYATFSAYPLPPTLTFGDKVGLNVNVGLKLAGWLEEIFGQMRYEHTFPVWETSIFGPVDLATHAVSLSAPSSHGGSAGSTISYGVRVTNEGLFDDTYSITVSSVQGWGVNVSPSTLSLASGETEEVTVSVDLPVAGGTSDITVTATSQGPFAVSDSFVTSVRSIAYPTKLTYTGDTGGQYSDLVYLRAKLENRTNGAPLGGKTIRFTLGDQTFTTVTNAQGIASKEIQLMQRPGTYTVKAEFAGSPPYLPAQVTQSFTISKEETRLKYTGAGSGQYSDLAWIEVKLEELDGSLGTREGRLIEFTLKDSAGRELWAMSSRTDESGRALVAPKLNWIPGEYFVEAKFKGDNHYLASSIAPRPFSIEKEDTELEVELWFYEPDFEIGMESENLTLLVRLEDDPPFGHLGGKPIKLTIDDLNYTFVTDSGGRVKRVLGLAQKMEYVVSVAFRGDDYYKPSYFSDLVKIKRRATELRLLQPYSDIRTTTYSFAWGTHARVRAELSDKTSGQPLENKTIHFELESPSAPGYAVWADNGITNGMGIAVIEFSTDLDNDGYFDEESMYWLNAGFTGDFWYEQPAEKGAKFYITAPPEY